jgi:pseudouridine-5'-phosphate glycosidase
MRGMPASKSFHLSDEIERAISESRPAVALESTVIAHGLPRPQNLQTALRLEKIIRESGVVPATVGILTGQIRVGLNEAEIGTLANSDAIRKLSTRDLPIAAARRWNGATTVAATIWIAHRAGIKVLATGGIGGVHRGPLPDVSADLPELARTPMIVVCSGAKIVLDLSSTREWLETHSLTVVGYGCDEMPAFYSRSSGLSVDVRCDSFAEVIDMYQAQRQLGMDSALVVAVPVPSEAEVETALLTRVLEESLLEAEQRKISGRELTPFLLARMAHCSEGATLRANIALLENNARVAAGIARALRERMTSVAMEGHFDIRMTGD